MWRVVLALALTCICTVSIAEKSSLSSLNHALSKLSNAMIATEQKQSQTEEVLKANEMAIASTSAQKDTINASLHEKKTDISHLKTRIADIHQRLVQQERVVDQLTRIIYMQGTMPLLKNLFDPEHHMRQRRLASYYQYLVGHYLQAVQALLTSQRELKQTKLALQLEINKLNQMQQQLDQKSQRLKTAYQQHQTLLVALRKKHQTQHEKLLQLQHARAQLQHTIALHAGTVAASPRPFRKRKHHLRWPVHGHLLQRFGSVIAHSHLHTDAIIIKAASGMPVHAIAPGTVVYSGWMRHYGQLLIINHSNDYLSLYGFNEQLIAHVGDTVTTGQVIAKVGQSGGQHQPSLYFGLRQHSQALNPLQWFA